MATGPCLMALAAAPHCCAAAPPRRAPLRVRRGVAADVDAVSALVASAFVELPGSVPRGDGSVQGYAQFMETRFEAAAQREMCDNMLAALAGKERAARAARAFAAQRRAAAARRALAALRAGDAADLAAIEAALPGLPAAEAARTRRARMWNCLLARNGDDDALLGVAVLSWTVPDAALPPPFPSSRPFVAYLSNMAVSAGARRAGVGSALLSAALRLARRWGAPALYLHVDESNETARAFYGAAGWEAEGDESGTAWWVPPGRRRLLLSRCTAAALSPERELTPHEPL